MALDKIIKSLRHFINKLLLAICLWYDDRDLGITLSNRV